jgi:hypothetical protein
MQVRGRSDKILQQSHKVPGSLVGPQCAAVPIYVGCHQLARAPRPVRLHHFTGVCTYDPLVLLGAHRPEASAFRDAGFSGASVNLDQLIASGARDLDRQRETLARIKERIDKEML